MFRASKKTVNKFSNEKYSWEETTPVINVNNSKLGTVISVTSTLILPHYDNAIYRLFNFDENEAILKGLTYSNKFVTVERANSIYAFRITARAFHNEVDDYNESKGILLAKVRLGEAINRLKAKYNKETLEILESLITHYAGEFKKYKNLQSNKVDRIVEITSEKN